MSLQGIDLALVLVCHVAAELVDLPFSDHSIGVHLRLGGSSSVGLHGLLHFLLPLLLMGA